MPIAKIEARKKWSDKEKGELIESLHRAMMQALKIPFHDKLIRLIEHSPENFLVPPGGAENYTLVEITMFQGRSLDAKRNLYKEIVQEYGQLGISPGDIRIVLYEVPMEN